MVGSAPVMQPDAVTRQVDGAHAMARLTAVGLTVNAALAVLSMAESAVRQVLVHRVMSGAAVDLAVAAHDDARWNALRTVIPVLGTVGGVVFLLWVYRTHGAARALALPGRMQPPGAAVAGFFIPGLNLVRPYQSLRDLDRALNPAAMPEQSPRPRADGAGHYRVSALAPSQAVAPTQHAPVAAWWALWLAGNAMGVAAFLVAGGGTATAVVRESQVLMVGDALTAAALGVAAVMVRRMDARLRACATGLSPVTSG